MLLKTRRKIVAAAAGVLLLLSFQNCSVIPHFNSSNNAGSITSSSANGGNDQGYDGMVFAHQLAAGVCADGSNVDTKIAFDAANATLLRDKCHALDPAHQQIVNVVMNPTDPTRLSYNSVNFNKVDPSLCTMPPAGLPSPVMDLAAVNFDPSAGDMWHNAGTGGWMYDFNRMIPVITSSYAAFVGGAHPYFSFDGDDHMYAYYGPTDLFKSLNAKGTKFTLVYEGYMSSGRPVAMLGDGGWYNRAGIALTYSAGALSYQVGNNATVGASTGSICDSSVSSLCAQGPTVASANAGTPLFAAVSIDEAAGTGVLHGNGVSTSFNSTYSKAPATYQVHEMDIGGMWEGVPDNGSRVYRVRLFDQALTAAQLSALYQQSNGACPY